VLAISNVGVSAALAALVVPVQIGLVSADPAANTSSRESPSVFVERANQNGGSGAGSVQRLRFFGSAPGRCVRLTYRNLTVALTGLDFHQGTEAPQMRENMSLLSFWGLIFSLIAVTLFVVIYLYQRSKNANRNIVEDLRQRSVSIYLAAETREAETDSRRFRGAADEIERLRVETSVLFWLIIAMNAAVIIIFALAYRLL
jgi:hypothetical protein